MTFMSFPFYSDPESIDNAAHIIQMALTPIFMLSGIGTLINIFNTRLARVSDKLEEVNKRLFNPPKGEEEDADNIFYTPERLKARQKRLRRRVFALDLAIILNVMGGAFTCAAALALFVLGSISDSSTTIWLLALFGAALACTVFALTAFLADTLLSWHGLRREGKASLLLMAWRAEERQKKKASSS